MINKLLKHLPERPLDTDRLGTGAAAAFGLKILGQAFGYGFTVFIARTYSPETLGYFLSSFLLLEVAIILSSFGMSTAVVSLTSRFNVISGLKLRRKHQMSVLLHSWYFSLPAASVFTVLLIYLSDAISSGVFHSPPLSGFIRIMALAIVPLTMTRLLLQYLRGRNRTIIYSFFSYVMLNMGMLIFLPVVKSFVNRGNAVPMAYLCSALLLAVCGLVTLMIIRNREDLDLKAEADEKFVPSTPPASFSTKDLTAIARPMLLADIMDFAKAWMGTFFIGVYLSQYYVGIYGIAAKLAAAVGLIATALSVVVVPRLGEYYGRSDWKAMQRLLSVSANKLFMLTGASVLGIILFGRLVMDIIGKDYGSSYGILIVLSLSPLITSFLGVGSYLLQVINRQNIYVIILACNTVLVLIMYNLLIPAFGLYGAAVTEVMFSLVMAASLSVYIKKKLNLRPWFKVKE